MNAKRELRDEWGTYVVETSRRAQQDRSTAIPRLIVAHVTGRAPSAPEIKAVAKLCNTIDRSHGGKTYAVTDVDVRAALDSIAVPAMF